MKFMEISMKFYQQMKNFGKLTADGRMVNLLSGCEHSYSNHTPGEAAHPCLLDNTNLTQ